MGDDDAVPFPTGDLGREKLAPLAGHILLGGDQKLGVGVKLYELAGKLLQ